MMPPSSQSVARAWLLKIETSSGRARTLTMCDRQHPIYDKRLVFVHLKRLFLFQMTAFFECLFRLAYYAYLLSEMGHWIYNHCNTKEQNAEPYVEVTSHCKSLDILWAWQFIVSVLMTVVMFLTSDRFFKFCLHFDSS